MTRRSRIAVVGSANVDLTTFSDRFPKAGRDDLRRAASTSAGAARAPTRRWRRGSAAPRCRWSRASATISSARRRSPTSSPRASTRRRCASSPGASSGVAPIFVESNGQNRIIVVKGANDRLLPADVDEAHAGARDRRLHRAAVRDPARDGGYHTVRFARQRGIRCIVNPAPAQPVDLARARRRRLLRAQRDRGRDDHRHAGPVGRRRQGVRGAPGAAGPAARHHHPRREGRAGRARRRRGA